MIKTRNNTRYPLNHYHFLILLVSMLLFTTACTKDDDATQKEYQTDVYTTGYQLDDNYTAIGKLWKNGVASDLTVPGGGGNTIGHSLFVTRKEK